MSQPAASEPIKSLSARALATWDIIAPDWDAAITADGNKYWRRLQEPSLRRLLSPTLSANCRRALDLATGNGLCARWLLARGAGSVLATDGSEGMLELARGHGHGYKGMRFRKVDVTSEKDLRGLVEEEAGWGFDAVLMNMAIMDVGDLEPLAKALKGGLLAQDGV
jgi:ubiquinone/menaquinone biosynthesis C-methylase UbiE